MQAIPGSDLSTLPGHRQDRPRRSGVAGPVSGDRYPGGHAGLRGQMGRRCSSKRGLPPSRIAYTSFPLCRNSATPNDLGLNDSLQCRIIYIMPPVNHCSLTSYEQLDRTHHSPDSTLTTPNLTVATTYGTLPYTVKRQVQFIRENMKLLGCGVVL